MNPPSIPNQEVVFPELEEKQIKLFIKREDTIHPFISGNKYRKLKYNVLEAKNQGHHTVLTFGGAYSNHIAATAYAGYESGLKTIGVVRGEELKEKGKENPTLRLASEHGMQLHFVTREDYRAKSTPRFIENLKRNYGPFYVIPEGGTNTLAVQGCEEILTESDQYFDFICCCVGTGGTIAGLINSSHSHQSILGFPALKGDFLKEDIRKFVQNDRWKLLVAYHFGGYAKVDKSLINFINAFKKQTGIPLDPVLYWKNAFWYF